MKKIINKFIVNLYRSANKRYQNYIYSQYRGKYKISDKFSFKGKDIKFYGKGMIFAGPNSYIGNYSSVLAYDNCQVKIGANCRISHNVRIYTMSAIVDQDFNEFDSLKIKTGDVCIEDAVWIGANVFINPGVTIGNNAVIGANSMVTKNVPENAIFGGVPAKLIRYKNI